MSPKKLSTGESGEHFLVYTGRRSSVPLALACVPSDQSSVPSQRSYTRGAPANGLPPPTHSEA